MGISSFLDAIASSAIRTGLRNSSPPSKRNSLLTVMAVKYMEMRRGYHKRRVAKKCGQARTVPVSELLQEREGGAKKDVGENNLVESALAESSLASVGIESEMKESPDAVKVDSVNIQKDSEKSQEQDNGNEKNQKLAAFKAVTIEVSSPVITQSRHEFKLPELRKVSSTASNKSFTETIMARTSANDTSSSTTVQKVSNLVRMWESRRMD